MHQIKTPKLSPAYANFDSNIPYVSRAVAKFHNFDISFVSVSEKWHLAIPSADINAYEKFESPNCFKSYDQVSQF